MRRVILAWFLIFSGAAFAHPATQPTLEELRPHFSGPVKMVSVRVREAQTPVAQTHYIYAQPAPYIFWGWGCGCYGCYWNCWP